MGALKFEGRFAETKREEGTEDYELVEFVYVHEETHAFNVVIFYEKVYTTGYPKGFNPWAVGVRVGGDLNLTSMPLLGASALIASAVALHQQLGHHVEFDNDVNVAR